MTTSMNDAGFKQLLATGTELRPSVAERIRLVLARIWRTFTRGPF